MAALSSITPPSPGNTGSLLLIHTLMATKELRQITREEVAKVCAFPTSLAVADVGVQHNKEGDLVR